MTGRKLLLAMAAALVPIAPALAGLCDNAPGERGKSVPREAILTKAKAGRELLRREISSSGPSQRLIRVDREVAFERVSTMHWRWFCDRQAGLATQPDLRAEALVQGVLFFDLANDVDNMKTWYPDARSGVRHLVSQGAQVPTFWSQPLDRLLSLASSRLSPVGRLRQEWFFDTGSAGGHRSGGR